MDVLQKCIKWNQLMNLFFSTIKQSLKIVKYGIPQTSSISISITASSSGIFHELLDRNQLVRFPLPRPSVSSLKPIQW